MDVNFNFMYVQEVMQNMNVALYDSSKYYSL